jgi:hypothetical protein
MATDSDAPEGSKTDAMEVDTANEVVEEKQRLRLVNSAHRQQELTGEYLLITLSWPQNHSYQDQLIPQPLSRSKRKTTH